MGLPAIERKIALDLFPYFDQKHIVIFDVGSNKGHWSDVLANNVDEIHLFEPNELLLHYTMVRYDYLNNVFYNQYAISDKSGVSQFYYFTNENNGLSSLYDNPGWDTLPKKKKEVETHTIDYTISKANVDHIDFLKIDIEGGEFNAITGAKQALANHKIKFVQVEKNDHVHLSGHTFDEVVKLFAKFGYYPMETEDKENVIFTHGEFTQNWNTQFRMNTERMKFNFALEIGCFEGLTSRYICDNLLNPGGRLICVDPLTDQYLDNHADNHIFVGQYDRFTRNTKGYPIELIRKKSEDAFEQLKDYRFDLIYIDGDHTEAAVFNDAVHAFRMCREDGGYILFDDWNGYDEGTTRGISRFLDTQIGNFEIVKDNYQLMIKRIK